MLAQLIKPNIKKAQEISANKLDEFVGSKLDFVTQNQVSKMGLKSTEFAIPYESNFCVEIHKNNENCPGLVLFGQSTNGEFHINNVFPLQARILDVLTMEQSLETLHKYRGTSISMMESNYATSFYEYLRIHDFTEGTVMMLETLNLIFIDKIKYKHYKELSAFFD